MFPTEDNKPTTVSRWMPGALAILAVVVFAGLIESGRRFGFQVPAPFLLMFGTVAISAGLAGLRIGLVAATLAALFIVYSSIQQFGPLTLTGSGFNIFVGSSIAYMVAYLLGSSRDKRIDLADRLLTNEARLRKAQQKLEERFERETEQLGAVTTELSSVRNQLDTAIHYSPVGVVLVGVDRKLASANPAALQMLGLQSPPNPDVNIWDFLQRYEIYYPDGERVSAGSEPLSAALDSGQVSDGVEFRLVRPDGSTGWFRGSMAPVRAGDNESIAGAAVTIAEITESRRSANAMRDLSRMLMRVQEDERTRLSMELHDEIGQNMAALNMNLHALKSGSGDPNLLADSIAQVRDLTDTINNLSVELRPAMLDDLGLISALRWYLGRQQQRWGHGINFDADVSLGRLPFDITTASFRIVQEAVVNAIKHANCNTLTVRVYTESNRLCVEISDDGVGFEAAREMGARETESAIGLLSMNERVSQLGGDFQIDSAPGKGTRIMACFPTIQDQ